MICAYNELYLEDARETLGNMFNHAYHMQLLSDDRFIMLFSVSDIAGKFETGVPRVIAGRSGAELVYEVLDEFNKSYDMIPAVSFDRDAYYWIGYSLAYYQWKKNIRFSEVLTRIPFEEIVALYPKYHEMDVEHFVEVIDEMTENTNGQARIKTLRRLCRYTQKMLAEKSGVPVRTIQQYEQKQKDINKARVETIICIADALGCKVTDILE